MAFEYFTVSKYLKAWWIFLWKMPSAFGSISVLSCQKLGLQYAYIYMETRHNAHAWEAETEAIDQPCHCKVNHSNLNSDRFISSWPQFCSDKPQVSCTAKWPIEAFQGHRRKAKTRDQFLRILFLAQQNLYNPLLLFESLRWHFEITWL